MRVDRRQLLISALRTADAIREFYPSGRVPTSVHALISALSDYDGAPPEVERLGHRTTPRNIAAALAKLEHA